MSQLCNRLLSSTHVKCISLRNQTKQASVTGVSGLICQCVAVVID